MGAGSAVTTTASAAPIASCKDRLSPTGSASVGSEISFTPVPCIRIRPKSNRRPMAPWSRFTSSIEVSCNSSDFRRSQPRFSISRWLVTPISVVQIGSIIPREDPCCKPRPRSLSPRQTGGRKHKEDCKRDPRPDLVKPMEPGSVDQTLVVSKSFVNVTHEPQTPAQHWQFHARLALGPSRGRQVE